MFTRLRPQYLLVPLGFQAGFTVASLTHSSQQWPFNYSNTKRQLPDQTTPTPETQSRHSAAVLGVLLSMFGNCCVAERCFDKDVEFCGPLAARRGFGQLQETVRVMKSFKARTLGWELISCTSCEDNWQEETVTLDVWQMYRWKSWELPLYSRLVVTVVDDDQNENNGTNAGCRITRITEQWNGVPLLAPFLGKPLRRANELVLYLITSCCLPADNSFTD